MPPHIRKKRQNIVVFFYGASPQAPHSPLGRRRDESHRKNKLYASLLSRACSVLRTLDNAYASCLAPLLRIPFCPSKRTNVAIEVLPKPRSINRVTQLADFLIMKKCKQKFPKIRKTISDNQFRSVIVYVARSEYSLCRNKRENITFFNAVK